VVFRVAIAQYEGSTTLRAPPLAAGLLAATVRREPDLADVTPRVLAARRDISRAADALADADLAGLSLYTWNTRYALEVARAARERNAALRIVAGGPSVPRRPDAVARFLDAHPWIDALVLGEGERAFCEVIRATRAGTPLGAVAGVVARADDGAVAYGPPRERMSGEAFDAIGSPYLDGTFEELVERGEISAIGAAVLETNRGCPFACTFCDWGQATHSRVHELPGARVERELAWLAERKVPYLYLVDANFGIRRRDEDITRAIGELARSHGAPQFVFFHLTKNATAKNLRTVEILREHGVATQVALSMQDFDPDVLVAIKRDNIRPADALALRERCHAQGIPTMNELLLGLPGQTAASIRASVTTAITPFPADSFFLYPTRVLENAEMAEPAYRARHGLETRKVPWLPPDPSEAAHVVEDEEIIVGTSALSVDAWREAYAFGYLLSALWNQRVLQTTIHVVRFALERDLPRFIDALLAGTGPRLRAVRAALDRLSAAILTGEATTLPVDGAGPRRREPTDAVCAEVLADPAAFYAEVADVAEAFARDADTTGAVASDADAVNPATILRDAVAWDALQALPPDGSVEARRFAFDWRAYAAKMGERPQPREDTFEVRVRAWPPATPELSGRLDVFLALGWSKQARFMIEAPHMGPVTVGGAAAIGGAT
jgi:radical SAM superfamily enzyme YgiQ (UPF0313 family)